MCKKSICLIVIFTVSQMVLASPIPEETPGLPEMESIAYYPAYRPVIDGDLSDWIDSEVAWKYFDDQSNLLRGDWGGPEDSSIMWSIMWDDTNLYFAAVVWDDVLTEPPNITAGWRGDAIFLYIDGNADGTRDHLMNMFIFEGEPYVISLNNASVSPDRIPYPKGQIAIELDSRMGEAGRFVEVAIPLEYIVDMTAEIGGEFRLNVGLEEGNQEPDGGKFLCWTNQEPGTDGNQFPVNFAEAKVKLETAEFELPLDGAVDVPQDTVLSWKSGASATSHDVYFGTDMEAVSDANNTPGVWSQFKGNQDPCSYNPGPLEFAQTYHWRIDELNGTEPDSTTKGHIWSFTTIDFVVVEDFEDYNDYTPNEVFMTWEDGYFDPTNGATAGYPAPDFIAGEHYLEAEIVHGGDFSMPLFYDNSVGLSEVTRTLNADWTIYGVNTLTLWYHGVENNAAEQMYIAIDDVVIPNDDSDAALVTEWIRWDTPLQTLADQGVDLSNVGSMSIGFGNRANPVAGGEGHVFFDDIRLYLLY